MKKGLCTLALGAFCFGMSEFIMMSILPDIAASLNLSIATTGHLISAYALGVCAGAPLMVIVARNYPLKSILSILIIMMITGSALMAVSVNYPMALCARFLTGLPHGSFFGVGAIVANRLAKSGKGTSAIAMMMMGMTIANLAGVPLGNYIGHICSWRLIFIFNALCGGLTVWAIHSWLPTLAALPKTTIKSLFKFLTYPTPWLLIIATVLGNGGVFCWYSYISPFMTEISGFSAEVMPLLMLLTGGSMCVGNYLGGYLSDKFTPGIVAAYIQGVLATVLLLLFICASNSILSIILMCICTAGFFASSAPMPQLMLHYSRGSEMMGGALAQLAFNLGNALGAYAGGVSIEQGSIVSIAFIGSVITLSGAMLLVSFNYYPQHKYKVVLILSKITRRI